MKNEYTLKKFKNNSLDINIVLKIAKEILSKKEYYILYNSILNSNNKQFREIAKELDFDEGNIIKIEKRVLEKVKNVIRKNKRKLNKIDELELYPMSPKQISLYLHLKENLDVLTYYFIYTRNLKSYDISKYKQIFPFMSEEEIKEKISICEELEKEIFTEENINSIFKRIKDNYTISQIFDLDIKPTRNIDYTEIYDYISNLSLEEVKMTDYYQQLDISNKQLIDKFFKLPQYVYKRKELLEKIEADINLFLIGYNAPEKQIITKSDIEDILNNYPEILTDSDIEFIMENIYGNKKLDIKHQNHYLEKFIKIKFRIEDFFANNITLEQLEYIKSNHKDILTDNDWDIIDKYYGYHTPKKSMKEIAKDYNLEYSKLRDRIRILRRRMLFKYYNLELEEKDIETESFIKILLDNRYSFGEEGKKVLKLYIINKMSYKEISEVTGYSLYKVSNFITEGVRKLNFYRYGIIKPIIIDKEELDNYFKTINNYTEEEKEIIYKRFIEGIDAAHIKTKSNLRNQVKLATIKRFYDDYLKTKLNEINIDIYKKELSCHISDSVLTERERIYVSMRFGIKYGSNIEGKKYKMDEIAKFLSISKPTYINLYKDINIKIRERLLNMSNPRYGLFTREEVEELLKDNNLPISAKEREILCHLKEIRGYQYMKEEELAQKYNMSKSSLYRRYQRAILSILQYKNNKKENQISWEQDIKPVLKYFSTYDENILRMYYKDKYTNAKISEELNVSLVNAHEIIYKLKINLKEILTDSKTAKKFDFEYARSVINNDDLPLATNQKELLIKIFEMLTGENNDKKYSAVEVKSKLNLKFTTSAINRALYTVMIAVEKYKLGIRKKEFVTAEEIAEYYKNYKEDMTKTKRNVYGRYLKSLGAKESLNKNEYIVPSCIVYDILKDQNKLKFHIKDKSREDMINFLLQNKDKLKKSTIKSIKEYYEIPERLLMTGREKQKVIKLLNPVYILKHEDRHLLKKE